MVVERKREGEGTHVAFGVWFNVEKLVAAGHNT